jgi:hypothetical protein
MYKFPLVIELNPKAEPFYPSWWNQEEEEMFEELENEFVMRNSWMFE